MIKKSFKGSTMLNPVPVVLITSKDCKGNINVFTAAWVGTVCTKPPMISVSIRPERLSYDYIKNSKEFVINLPSKDMTYKVDFCGVRSGKKLDKIKKMNFTLENSKIISTPMIKECPINLECKLKNIIQLGSHDLFLAEIVQSNINSNLIDKKGKIHFEKANLISYCHGEYYPLPKKSLGSFGYSVKKK